MPDKKQQVPAAVAHALAGELMGQRARALPDERAGQTPRRLERLAEPAQALVLALDERDEAVLGLPIQVS